VGFRVSGGVSGFGLGFGFRVGFWVPSASYQRPADARGLSFVCHFNKQYIFVCTRCKCVVQTRRVADIETWICSNIKKTHSHLVHTDTKSSRHRVFERCSPLCVPACLRVCVCVCVYVWVFTVRVCMCACFVCMSVCMVRVYMYACFILCVYV